MKSIRSDNVFLFDIMKDESLEKKIVAETPVAPELPVLTEYTTRQVKQDGINFNSWFTVCNKRPEDEKNIIRNAELPPSLTPIIYSLYSIIGIDYTKRTVYNLVRKLDRFRYTIQYEENPVFENVMEDIIDEKYKVRIKKVVSKKEPAQRIRMYKEMYKYYTSIIDLSNDQLNEKFRYVIEALTEEYNELDTTSKSTDLFSDKELFITGNNMSNVRGKAFIIFYELMYRLFNIIDLSAYVNKIPDKTYVSKFFNIEYITLSNGLVYILLKNCKNFLVFDLEKKIKSITEVNTIEEGSYQYHTIKLINKVRGIYMFSFGSPIVKIKYNEDNMILFLEDENILVNGSNANGKILDNDTTEYIKFRSLTNKYRENGSEINKMKITPNYIVSLYKTGVIHINGKPHSDLIFNENNTIKINSNYLVYKNINKLNKQVIFSDFYISEGENVMITYSSDKRIYFSNYNTENSVLDFVALDDLIDITDVFLLNAETSLEPETPIECYNNGEIYNVTLDADISSLRQIILNDKALIFVKGSKIFIKGSYADIVNSTYLIDLKTEEGFYINKVFECVDSGMIIESIKKNEDETYSFRYHSFGKNNYGRNGNETTDLINLYDISDDVCVDSIGTVDYSIRIIKFVSDVNRTMILNSSNVVLGAGLNGGYFCELSNPIEVEDGQLPIPDIDNIERKFVKLLQTGDINNIADLIVNKEVDGKKVIVILPNMYRAYVYGSYYYLGFKTGGGYAVSDLIVETKEREEGLLNKVTNVNTISLFCSQNCIYTSNPFFDLASNALMNSDPLKVNSNELNINQLTKSLLYMGSSIIDYKYNSFVKKASLMEDTSDYIRNKSASISNKTSDYILENVFNFIINRSLIMEYSYIDTYSYIAAFLNYLAMMGENFSTIRFKISDPRTFVKCIEESNDVNSELPYDKENRINERIGNSYRTIAINN